MNLLSHYIQMTLPIHPIRTINYSKMIRAVSKLWTTTILNKLKFKIFKLSKTRYKMAAAQTVNNN